ncbi:MAG: outer membrane protein transport protein [Gammaproteobacteria bacterium]|nr:outer membrane protein transport protein [Gammaproteobacteria bacterium]
MNNSKRLLALAISAALAVPMAAHATNGMNLEGYGPIAMGMGGASMAYDNGTAAMMNNPATLGMMDEGSRLDVAVGFLNPTVTTEMGATDWESSATSFMMPALGWVKRDGKNTYGVGMFSQGGMGATYDDGSPGGAMSAPQAAANISYLDSFVGAPGITGHVSMDQAMMGTTTLDDYSASISSSALGLDEKSEVGVGRLIFPFTRNMSEKLTVGGSIDYVWAGMDLQMAMNGAMMADMMPGGTQTPGTITGGLIDGMGGMFFNPAVNNFDGSSGMPTMNDFGISGLNYGYFDFSDDSAFTGEAKGAGFAGKLGLSFKANDQLTIGATYHSKTSMGDLKTSNATVSMSTYMTTLDTSTGTMITMPADVVMLGDIAVQDFQWPSTIALGLSFKANDKLMIAADVKRVNWSEVMESFTMKFDADSITMAGMDVTAMFPELDMTSVMYQNWEDQTVISLGASYKVTDATTVRAGYNSASNPVPDETMNYLFPAVTETHYTLGLGHVINDNSSVDVALSHVPEVTGGGDNGFTTSMSQTNYQLMYSYKF